MGTLRIYGDSGTLLFFAAELPGGARGAAVPGTWATACRGRGTLNQECPQFRETPECPYLTATVWGALAEPPRRAAARAASRVPGGGLSYQ
jgi:hypothetical protein